MYAIPYNPSTRGRKPIIRMRVRYGAESHNLDLVHVDPQREFTILPRVVAEALNFRIDNSLRLAEFPRQLSYKGKSYDLNYTKVKLELKDVGGYTITWDATVAIWDAPNGSLAYLGMYEALEWLDPQIGYIYGRVDVTPNARFQGTIWPNDLR
jgi:hypothetical protein